VEVKVCLNAIEFGQSPFGETPKRFNAVDVNPFPIGEMFGLVDPEMLVVSHVNQSVIPPPPIGVNNGFRAYALENDLLKRSATAIRYEFGVHLSVAFEYAKDWTLPGTTTPFMGAHFTPDTFRSEVGLIKFYLFGEHRLQSFNSGTINGFSKQFEKTVYRISVNAQQVRGLGSIYIGAKMSKNFFNLVIAQFTIFYKAHRTKI